MYGVAGCYLQGTLAKEPPTLELVALERVGVRAYVQEKKKKKL